MGTVELDTASIVIGSASRYISSVPIMAFVVNVAK